MIQKTWNRKSIPWKLSSRATGISYFSFRSIPSAVRPSSQFCVGQKGLRMAPTRPRVILMKKKWPFQVCTKYVMWNTCKSSIRRTQRWLMAGCWRALSSSWETRNVSCRRSTIWTWNFSVKCMTCRISSEISRPQGTSHCLSLQFPYVATRLEPVSWKGPWVGCVLWKAWWWGAGS